MTRTPDPAAEGIPVPHRRAAQAMPGGPGPSNPPEGSGGKTPPRTVHAAASAILGGSTSGETDREPGVPAGNPEPGRGSTAASMLPRPGQEQDAARTWTLELPAGLPLLSLNGREHWSERARRTEALKKAAWALAKQAKIPRLQRASVVVEYQPPAARRRRDAENTPAPSGKACVDGLVAAGVLEDDECPRYVAGIYCTIGQPYPKGRLVLHVTEIAATGGDAA